MNVAYLRERTIVDDKLISDQVLDSTLQEATVFPSLCQIQA